MACIKINTIRVMGLLITAVLFSSCVVSRISVDVQRPADIKIPEHIRNVVLANRSIPYRENRTQNLLEGLLSGEDIGIDRRGSQYCIDGLTSLLNINNRFKVSKAPFLTLKGTGTSEFPPVLDWNQVDELCKTYKSDALIVLATFDADSKIYSEKPRESQKKIDGVKTSYLEYPAILSMKIESGWRIYDIKNKVLIEENKFIDVKEFKNWGKSLEDAKMFLPSKMRSLKDAGVFSGEQFGFRISPIWVKVNRYYYIGKENNFKKARENIKDNRWDDAVEKWKILANSSDNTTSGRACFNMALASEIKGNIDIAIDWVEKAYNLGEKRAKSYLSTLENRRAYENKLKQQINIKN